MKIKINNKEVEVNPKDTVLKILNDNKIKVPTLCFHPDLNIKANCRVCSVIINGKFMTTCSTYPEEGMIIDTESDQIKKFQSINLSLIYNGQKEIEEIAQKYNIPLVDLPKRDKNLKELSFGPSIYFDPQICMNCRNCVGVCPVNFLDIKERSDFHDVYVSDKEDCVYCGQCALHCPIGAIKERDNTKEVEDLLNRNHKVIFQFAPSVRVSIGEEFGYEPGRVFEEEISYALHKLGAYKVFDTSVGADFTTYEEFQEVKEKIEKGKVCFTSCCPAWVKFIEHYYPEFIPNLATTRSPQIILGGVIKTYYAQKEGINPKKIRVVSIMPCTAKKYEVRREELKIDGMYPVDYILTTRELAELMKKNDLDLSEKREMDSPFSNYSGGGVIYGSSGGVFEAVMREIYGSDVNTEKIRGEEGLKKIYINEKTFVSVSGLKNVKGILEELKNDPKKYAGVEVMACPGGCIGGGGQPIPTTKKIVEKRRQGLYNIDINKNLKTASKNNIIEEVYKSYLSDNKNRKKVCHTTYKKKKKEVRS